MKLRVGGEGLSAAAEGLAAVAEGLCAGAAAGLTAGLSAMAEMARENAPVQSGRLRGSIGSEARARLGGAEGALYAEAPYAAAVELGGGFTPARPFLHPAAEAGMEALRETVRENVLGGGG